MELAACRESNPEDFFDNYLESEEVVATVAELCRSCQVRRQCLNFGVSTKSVGVWGGRWLSNGRMVKKKETIINDYFWRDE